jgi:hypothetical protein
MKYFTLKKKKKYLRFYGFFFKKKKKEKEKRELGKWTANSLFSSVRNILGLLRTQKTRQGTQFLCFFIFFYLNVEFEEIDRQFSGGIEGENRVLFKGFHSWVRGLQHVHSEAPVSHHHKIRGEFIATFDWITIVIINT